MERNEPRNTTIDDVRRFIEEADVLEALELKFVVKQQLKYLLRGGPEPYYQQKRGRNGKTYWVLRWQENGKDQEKLLGPERPKVAPRIPGT